MIAGSPEKWEWEQNAFHYGPFRIWRDDGWAVDMLQCGDEHKWKWVSDLYWKEAQEEHWNEEWLPTPEAARAWIDEQVRQGGRKSRPAGEGREQAEDEGT